MKSLLFLLFYKTSFSPLYGLQKETFDKISNAGSAYCDKGCSKFITILYIFSFEIETILKWRRGKSADYKPFSL